MLAGGGGLMAALHASMEKSKTIMRCIRGSTKKPQMRNEIDIGYIQGETSKAALLTANGPGQHRDLCHMVKPLHLKEMANIKVPGIDFSGPVYIFVLQGKLQIRCRDKAPFASKVRAGPPVSETGEPNSAGASGSASETEMRALFDSIDADGSGAIDVDELSFALEQMGVHKSEEEVQEMMDAVDTEGEGELSFDMFKEILRRELEGNKNTCTDWYLKGDYWCQEVLPGGSLGEVALIDDMAQDAHLMALEDTRALCLERADYLHILENGFDGELKAKMNAMGSASAMDAALKSTDRRALAYATTRAVYPRNGVLYGEGQQANTLFLIIEGNCKVTVKVEDLSRAATDSRHERGPGLAAHLLRSNTHYRGGKHMRRLELAILGPGDMCGEACLLDEHHPHTCTVASSELVVLQLDRKLLKRLMHPGDVASLRAHFERREFERMQRVDIANTALAPEALRTHSSSGAALAMQTIDNGAPTSSGRVTFMGAVAAANGNGGSDDALAHSDFYDGSLLALSERAASRRSFMAGGGPLTPRSGGGGAGSKRDPVARMLDDWASSSMSGGGGGGYGEGSALSEPLPDMSPEDLSHMAIERAKSISAILAAHNASSTSPRSAAGSRGGSSAQLLSHLDRDQLLSQLSARPPASGNRSSRLMNTDAASPGGSFSGGAPAVSLVSSTTGNRHTQNGFQQSRHAHHRPSNSIPSRPIGAQSTQDHSAPLPHFFSAPQTQAQIANDPVGQHRYHHHHHHQQQQLLMQYPPAYAPPFTARATTSSGDSSDFSIPYANEGLLLPPTHTSTQFSASGATRASEGHKVDATNAAAAAAAASSRPEQQAQEEGCPPEPQGSYPSQQQQQQQQGHPFPPQEGSISASDAADAVPYSARDSWAPISSGWGTPRGASAGRSASVSPRSRLRSHNLSKGFLVTGSSYQGGPGSFVHSLSGACSVWSDSSTAASVPGSVSTALPLPSQRSPPPFVPKLALHKLQQSPPQQQQQPGPQQAQSYQQQQSRPGIATARAPVHMGPAEAALRPTSYLQAPLSARADIGRLPRPGTVGGMSAAAGAFTSRDPRDVARNTFTAVCNPESMARARQLCHDKKSLAQCYALMLKHGADRGIELWQQQGGPLSTMATRRGDAHHHAMLGRVPTVDTAPRGSAPAVLVASSFLPLP